jgi:ketosteroid isomerase-like protein
MEMLRRLYTIQFDRLSPGSIGEAIRAFVAWLDPDVEFNPREGEPGEQTVRGRTAVRRMLEEAAEEWDACRYEAHDCVQLDDDRVLVSGRLFARARGGGAEFDLPFAHVWTIRDGVAMRIEAYADSRQAASSALTDG